MFQSLRAIWLGGNSVNDDLELMVGGKIEMGFETRVQLRSQRSGWGVDKTDWMSCC